MTADIMKYFRIAKELNEECKDDLIAKKLHFRGNMGSFSLISLCHATPEQGKVGLKKKESGKRFLDEGIDSHLAAKRDKIVAGKSKPTREKELQAWIINYAVNHEYKLPFSTGLTFLTSELAFNDSKKIVNDILALDEQGCLVVLELKSSRNKKTLEGQVEGFCDVISSKQDFFKELVALLASERGWNGRIRKMIVWPDANVWPDAPGRARTDWRHGIEEVRYREYLDEKRRRQIYFDGNDEIVFLSSQ